MSAATKSRSYTIRERRRGTPDGECGPIDVTYTDTVYESGRVDSHAHGFADGDRVNQRATRNVGHVLDLDIVHRARIEQGWREVKVAPWVVALAKVVQS